METLTSLPPKEALPNPDAEDLADDIGSLALKTTKVAESSPEEAAPAENRLPDNFEELLNEGKIRATTIENNDLNDKIGSERKAKSYIEPSALSHLASGLLSLAQYRQGGNTGVPETLEIAEQYVNMSPTELYDAANELLAKRESILAERNKQSNEKQDLEEARQAYVKGHKTRSGLSKAELEKLDADYNQAFVAYLNSIMQIEDREKILQAGYTPPTVLDMQKPATGIEEYSGNQLHMLVNELTRENLRKAKAIEDSSNVLAKKALKVLKSNRGLRIALGATIWAGSMMGELKGILPTTLQPIGEAFGQTLPYVGAYIAGRETLSSINNSIETFKTKRQIKEDVSRIAADTLLTDSALAMLYSNIEHENISGRIAGDTPAENAQVLNPAKINHEYGILDNAPGGKPYKAEKILPYVTDLLLRKRDLIEKAMSSEDPHQAFLELAQIVIAEDTEQLSKRVHESRAKKLIFRGIALVGSIVATNWVKTANGMANIPNTATDYLRPETA